MRLTVADARTGHDRRVALIAWRRPSCVGRSHVCAEPIAGDRLARDWWPRDWWLGHCVLGHLVIAGILLGSQPR